MVQPEVGLTCCPLFTPKDLAPVYVQEVHATQPRWQTPMGRVHETYKRLTAISLKCLANRLH